MIYEGSVKGWVPLFRPWLLLLWNLDDSSRQSSLWEADRILSLLRRDPHECWHVLVSTILPSSFQAEAGNFLWLPAYFIFCPFCGWANFPLLSWVRGLGNCIFSFSYCRGTIEQKSQCCFPLTHSLNTINFSFDAFFLSALIMLPQEMRANKSYPGVGEQGTDQILYNAVL